MERYARNALADEGVRIPWSEELGGYEVEFGTAKSPGAFDRLHGWLRWLHPIRSVQIASDPEFTNLAPLYSVIELEELTQLTILNNAALQTIEGLAGLGALTQLTISGDDALQTIEGLAGLGALTQLTIGGNHALQTIERLAGLGALTQLTISYNHALQTIEGLAGLGALTQLTILNNAALQTIEGLARLKGKHAPAGWKKVLGRGEEPERVTFVSETSGWNNPFRQKLTKLPL
jgi:Leucine-rich repeat (LRR) protein